MNPTDEVDDLLAKAGAQWRADQPSAPEPDLDRMLQHHKGPRRWVPALAAASVAAIATAALVVLPDKNEPSVAPSPGPVVAQSNGGADDLLVHNGDKVEVSGSVIAAPGKQPVFCPNLPVPAIGYPPGQEPAPSCPPQFEVKLAGVDLGRLTGLTTTKGVRSGGARLVGIWNDRTITVQEQTAPVATTPTPYRPSPVPCTAPPGGWPSRPSNILSRQMNAFLEARAAQIDGPVMKYPNGTSRNAPLVVTLGFAHGDLEEFRRAIGAVYQGNLCIVRTKFSRTDLEKISGVLTAAMAKELGITGGGGASVGDDKVGVGMVVFDEAVRDALAPIGLDQLDLHPDVKPVR